MYLPLRGSQTTIWLLGSKPVICQYLGFGSLRVLLGRTLEGKLLDLEALVRALGSRDDGSVADERVMDTRVRDQIGLELVQIDIEGTIEAQRRRNGADNLGDQAVQVVVRGAGNVEVSAADVVDSFVVNEEGTVRVLDGAVGRKNSVVRLDDGSRDTGGRVDGELELRLLAVLSRKALEKQGAETRAGTTTERVEDQETLQGMAVVCRILRKFGCGPTGAYAAIGDEPATRRTRSMTLSTISLPIV